MTTTEITFPAKVSATDTATNKAIGWQAQYQLLVEQDFSALTTYFKEDYLQHNPALRNGRDELTVFKKTNVPNSTTELVRCLGDRDLVFFVEKVTGLVPNPLCFFDVYRLEDGKIAEHWDAYVSVDGKNPAGRTMFDGPLEIGDPANTEDTRAHVIKLINNVFVMDNLSRLGTYVHEDVRQYTPGIDDGLQALRMHFLNSQWFTGDVSYRALRQVVAEGDFAMTACEAVIGETPFAIFDLWRVQDGKVSDHWSLRQKIEKSTFHHNPRV